MHYPLSAHPRLTPKRSEARLARCVGETALVDGNNLLHAAREAEPERPPSRSTLCRMLGEWAQRRGARVRVVFDGPEPVGDLREQIGAPGVTVHFSGSSTSADHVLGEVIRTSSAGRLMRVVSSDREIARVARRHRARPVRSDAFWRELTRPVAPPPTEVEPDAKRSGLQGDEARRWLDDFGMGESGRHAGRA